MKPKSVELKEKEVVYTINYYTELYGVISVLSENQKAIKNAGAERANEKYREEILNYFNVFKNHEVCKMLESFSTDSNFNYDAAVTMFLQLANGKLDRKLLCKDRGLITKKEFNNLIKKINYFEKSSNFKYFYTKSTKDYVKFLNNFVTDTKKYDPIKYLLNFLNLKNRKKLYINLMCSVASGNYCSMVGNKVYLNVQPYLKSRFNGYPDFSYEPIYYTTLILHEYAHLFINRLVEKQKGLIKNIDIADYEEILQNAEFGDNLEIYISETIIRAIECLYVKDVFPDKFDEHLTGYYKEGFVKIFKVVHLLEVYKNHKGDLNNFKDTMVQLVDCFT